MKKIRFTHKILVPTCKKKIVSADGYAEELADVRTFELTQKEYENLRKEGGLFDIFDKTFGTIIDDCEEDRIEATDILHAIDIVNEFASVNNCEKDSGIIALLHSLEFANVNGVFWEIVNGSEIYE